MKIIEPIIFTASQFTTNIPLPDADASDPPVWEDSPTSYSIGDEVYTTANFYTWISQTDSNEGNNPDDDDGTNWVRKGSVNRWASLNQIVQDQTTKAAASGTDEAEIVYTFTPGQIVTGASFINVTGARNINITMNDPVDGEVYNRDIDMSAYLGVDSWWNFYFAQFSEVNTAACTDLPPYIDATITITITGGAGATVGVGEIVLGNVFSFGDSQYGATFGIIDFSKKTTNEDTGAVTITVGPFSTTFDIDVVVDTNAFSAIKVKLESIRSQAVVWIPDETKVGSITYGYYREYDVVISNPTFTNLVIEVEGLA